MKSHIRSIEDFPKPGIIYRDITPLLANPAVLHRATTEMVQQVINLPGREWEVHNQTAPPAVAAVDSRGFIFGALLAQAFHWPLVLIRKEGKLPAETYKSSYTLEYGEATLEMHRDSILPDQEVIIVDDVLATGGTAAAAVDLVEQAGGKVIAISFIIELLGLGGRDKLAGYQVLNQITFY